MDLPEELIQEYKSEWLEILNDLFQRYESHPKDPQIISEVRHAAHKLAGTGTTYGFEMITKLAKPVELAIDHGEDPTEVIRNLYEIKNILSK